MTKRMKYYKQKETNSKYKHKVQQKKHAGTQRQENILKHSKNNEKLHTYHTRAQSERTQSKKHSGQDTKHKRKNKEAGLKIRARLRAPNFFSEPAPAQKIFFYCTTLSLRTAYIIAMPAVRIKCVLSVFVSGDEHAHSKTRFSRRALLGACSCSIPFSLSPHCRYLFSFFFFSCFFFFVFLFLLLWKFPKRSGHFGP